MINVEKITKVIDGAKVLDNISLQIKPAEILVIMGPSGSGKSTLLRNITLVDVPDEGCFTIGERKYHFPASVGMGVDEERGLTGIYPDVTLVFQQFFLWPHLTVEENIKLPIKPEGLSADYRRKLAEMYKLFCIESILHKYPNEISVGQKQKVSLVRALILNPKYIFLDEITSALDIESTLAVLSYLKKIRDEGVAVVFVTHALHIAQKIADKVIFIEHGKIVEEGSRDILFKPKTDRFKKFIDTPIYT